MRFVPRQDSNLQSLQECDQRRLLFGRQCKPELVSAYGSSLDTMAFESRGHVIIAQAACIEPIFKGGHRTVVFERSAIPDASQRRHFVVTGAAASPQREGRVGAYRARHDIEALEILRHRLESDRWRQLVVRVQRSGMAGPTSLAVEYVLPPFRYRVRLIGILRR